MYMGPSNGWFVVGIEKAYFNNYTNPIKNNEIILLTLMVPFRWVPKKSTSALTSRVCII